MFNNFKLSHVIKLPRITYAFLMGGAIISLLVALIVSLWMWGPELAWREHRPLASLTSRSLATLAMVMASAVIGWRSLRGHVQKHNALPVEKGTPPIDACQRAVHAQERDLQAKLGLLRAEVKGRNAVYGLPWYLVLGGSDAGKTALINRADDAPLLDTPLMEAGPNTDDDPARAIHWRLGRKALLLEHPGLFVHRSGAEEALGWDGHLWHGWIDWLRHTRQRRPLNGIVLTIDIAMLCRQETPDREAFADVLRHRIAELSTQLGTRLPVYIILTHFDRLPGFDTFFGRLPPAVRERLFGFAFSLASQSHPNAWLGELDKQYDAFLKRLDEQVFDAMAAVRSTAERQALYAFQWQMIELGPILRDVLAQVLGGVRETVPTLPRGVYFTATRQGDRDTSYFVNRLFERVIYPEAGLANDNPQVVARHRRALAWHAGLAACLTVALVGGWWHYGHLNATRVQQVQTLTQAYRSAMVDDTHDTTGRSLLPAMDHLAQAAAVFGNYRNASWLTDMGLYQGRQIGPRVEAAYRDLLATRFLPTLAAGVMQVLEQATVTGNVATQLEALRVYRMIADREHRRPEFVRAWMAQHWQAAYPGQATMRQGLMTHLDRALAIAEPRLPIDDGRLATLQTELRRIPLPERIYLDMQRQARQAKAVPLDLRHAIGAVFATVYQAAPSNPKAGSPVEPIDALLTAQGYRRYYLPDSQAVIDRAMVDQWALGERDRLDYAAAEGHALADRVAAVYSQAYIATWERQLAALQIRPFANLADAVTVLNAITGPAAPLQRLLHTVRDNTRLDEPADGKDPPTPREGVPPRVAQAFAPLNALLDPREGRPSLFDETMQALVAVDQWVKTVQASPSPGKVALAQVMDRLAGTRDDPIATLRRQALGLPPPLDRQMTTLADASARVIRREALRELNRRWEAEVYTFYRERLATRYPFAASRSDASLDDFTAFFGPQGHLQRFRDAYLDRFIDDGAVHTDVTAQLAAADRIRRAFFNARGELGIQFQFEPLAREAGLRATLITTGGQRINADHLASGPVTILWPNALGTTSDSEIIMTYANGSRREARHVGPWSLYQLLSRARLNGATDTSVDLSFAASDRGVGMRYRVSTERIDNPLVIPLFEGFALPKQVVGEEG